MELGFGTDLILELTFVEAVPVGSTGFARLRKRNIAVSAITTPKKCLEYLVFSVRRKALRPPSGSALITLFPIILLLVTARFSKVIQKRNLNQVFY